MTYPDPDMRAYGGEERRGAPNTIICHPHHEALYRRIYLGESRWKAWLIAKRHALRSWYILWRL